jgi:hypothetical protein
MRNQTSLIALVVISLLVVLGCGQLTDKIANEAKKVDVEKSGSFSLSGKEWKRVDLDDSDISVELPGQTVDKTPPDSLLPPGSKEVFSGMRIHAYDEKEFGSSYSQLEPTGKRKFTIKELADTSMAALKRQAPDLKYTLDVTSETNAKYDGTFTRNGKNFELKGCCIFKKSNPSRVWAIITVYPKDLADGKTASTRIIDSATFAGSTETCN